MRFEFCGGRHMDWSNEKVHISLYPFQNFEFLEPDDSLESKLQLGPVNLDGQLFPVRKEQCGVSRILWRGTLNVEPYWIRLSKPDDT